MKEIITMTPQELRNHIKECGELLKSKENERFNYLVGEVINAVQALYNEYPNTDFVITTYCEGCEQEVEVGVNIEHLAHKDKYIN